MEDQPLLENQQQIVRIFGLPILVRKRDTLKLAALLIGSVLSIGLVAFILVWCLAPPTRVRGVILLIPDGFGPASQTMARTVHLVESGITSLPLDPLLVGTSRTRSASSFVTDSAAGATAFSCAKKAVNGAIAVTPDNLPCGTVLEAAKEKGMLTALVATSRITHATPAAFSAHVMDRDAESQIALQQIGNYSLGRRVDLMFGGGTCYFMPKNDAGSCRSDQINVFERAAGLGWNIIKDLPSFEQLNKNTKLPVMALFASGMMAYEIDRNSTVEPSLKEMAHKALQIINHESLKSKKGFFIMIEGSRIDMAAHSNDPATHVRDILMFNNVIDLVKSFVDQNPDTVMVAVADHETGGISNAVQVGPEYPVYQWNPHALTHVKHSGEYIANQLASMDQTQRIKFVSHTVIPKWLNITQQTLDRDDVSVLLESPSKADIDKAVGRLVSRRAEIGWSTHGHSAVDVNIYAHGRGSSKLAGNRENTQIGDFIVESLGLDLDKITQKLNKAE